MIDSVVGGLIIVKTYINLEGTDERTLKLSGQITKNSVWVVEKAASLLNFNKAYLVRKVSDPKGALAALVLDKAKANGQLVCRSMACCFL